MRLSSSSYFNKKRSDTNHIKPLIVLCGQFSNHNKMLAFAGLDPSSIKSCTTSSKGKMVKHGSGYLRKTLMNITITCIVQCPKLYDYYLKKRSEGKTHRVAISHLCRKLIRMIYYLETTNLDFSFEKLN